MNFLKKHLKIINIILILIFLTFLIYLIINNKTNNYKEYSKDMFYMDTYINVKIYSNNNAEKELEKIDKLYKEYDHLANKYVKYNKNLYYINSIDAKTKIDPKLSNLIKYGFDLYDKTDGLLNINIGCVTDIWKEYRENENGIPNKDELNKCDINIKNIKLNNNLISGNFNIDLGSIAKGYVTELAGNLIEEDGYKYYIINAGGNIKVSEKYDNSSYKIGIQSPSDENKILGILNLKNKSVATSGGYERYYEYNNQLYHHIIDTKTLFPAKYMKSVSVIANTSKLADSMSTILFLMPIEEGKEFIKNYDVDVIWVDNNNNIIKTKGVNLDE